MPFHLWEAQRQVLADFSIHALIVILKARQLGITWLCCAYVLWLCLFQSGRVVLLFSKGQLEADELARRVRVMYDRLPDWLRERVPLVRDNLTELEWANGSRTQSLAATRSAGRSFTASLVLMDEAAFMQWATEVYSALKPTIDAGGQLFVVSTANGEGGLFHKLWTDAQKTLNNFFAIFLSWRARPQRDETWRARVAAEALSSATDLQEYPDTPGEAFQTTGNERFLPAIALWDACREELPPLTRSDALVLALDAAVSNDCFALVGVSRHPLRRKTDVAVRLQRVWQPHGQELDFDAIEKEIMQLLSTFNVAEIAFDPYQLHQMASRLGQRVWTRAFNQQTERLISDKQLLDLILERRIAHDGNTDLRQHLDNADRKVDVETRKLRMVKRTEPQKIDLAVALSMATAECLRLNLG